MQEVASASRRGPRHDHSRRQAAAAGLDHAVSDFKGFGSNLIAVATSDDEGRFRLECGVGKGACAGSYKATVTEYPVPPDMMRSSRTGDATIRQFYDKLPNRPIPAQFGDLASTPLRIEIVKGQGEYEIVLTR